MEPFELAEQREAQWDAILERLPECSRCGRKILDSRFLQYEDVALCGSCLQACMTQADVDW